MRLNLNRLVALAALAAAGLMAGCSADSPGPTGNPPPGGGGGGTNGLLITISATPSNPVQGTCSLVVATATQNGAPVPAGTSITLSSTFGTFSQNGQQTISLVTTNGSVQTAICSNFVGPATITGTVTVGGNTDHGSTQVTFQSNGIKTTFISVCANPHTGPVSGGTAITITGGGLGTDGTTVPVIFRSGAIVHQTVGTISGGGTTITTTTPAFPELAGLPATPVEVDVLIAGQTLSSPACFTFTSDSTPVISAILPASGTKVGGTRVTITGSGFSAPVQVFFGGTLEAQVVSVSPTQIVAITPPANGEGPQQTFPLTVDVTVKEVNCAGSACTSAAVPFTYTVGLSIFGFTPDHGDSSTTVTITGQGFVAPLIVTFGGVQGTVLSVSGTQILARPPAGCPGVPSGSITVTLLSDGESASSSTPFRVIVPSITTGPIPNSGAGGTSTSVTVIGTGLFPTGNASLLTVTAAGGSVNGSPTGTELNGQQTVTVNVTLDKCSPTLTLTFINGATGCAITASPITNSTFTADGPTASPTGGATTCTGSGHHYTASFSETPSSSGTTPFIYAWTFANSDGSAASPPSKVGAGPTGPITFICPDANPCSGTATLTVTDACGKTTSAPPLSVDSPGCP